MPRLWRTVFFFLTLVTAFLAGGFLHAAEVDIKSDYLEYDEMEKFIIARGSVTVSWQNKMLQARQVRFWVEKKYLIAEGDVALAENNGRLFADSMTFDYKTGEGDIERVSGYSEPWFIYAKRAHRTDESRYSIDRTLVTTCNLADPHYSVRAKRAKVVLGKRLTVYSPVFYLRDIPVFYLPIYTQSLRRRRESIEIQPGYNNEDGLTIRTIFGYPISPNTYGKLYLDYFSKKGWGKGAEYNYHVGDRIKGTLYGYQINEKNTGAERWTLRGSHWQRLDPLWTAQAEAEFLSDTSFNNLYFQQDWQRISQRLHSFAALTRQSGRSNLRLVTERYDVFNPLTGGFEAQNITVPRVEYTLYPVRSRLPFYTGLSLSLQNQYVSSNGYYQQNAVIDSNVTGDYRIGRKLTLKPRLGIRESWQDRTSAIDLTDMFITRYYSNLNARYRLARWADWDIGYNYQLRSQVNSLAPDINAVDYGEEINQLYFVNSMYLRSNIVLRNSTGYNLHINRYEVVEDWRRKFNPLVNEVTWTPPLGFYVYLRQENEIYPYSFKSLQADSRFGRGDDRYVNLGVFYQSARPDQLDFNTGFGFWPTTKWKIDYIIRATALNNFGEFRGNDQEIRVYRDLHCWQLKVTYRRRPNVEEFFVLLDLKSAAKNRDVLFPRKHEQEFYPWR